MKQTSAILWLAHSLEVLAILAGVTGGVGAYQSIASGDYTLSAIGGVFLAGALGVLFKGVSTIISNAQFAQAMGDLYSEATHNQGQTPPVVINNHLPPQAAPLTPMPVQPPVAQPAQLSLVQPAVSSGVVAQSPAQFKVPVPVVEHPPIDAGMMVNTLPTLPAFTAQQPQ